MSFNLKLETRDSGVCLIMCIANQGKGARKTESWTECRTFPECGQCVSQRAKRSNHASHASQTCEAHTTPSINANH